MDRDIAREAREWRETVLKSPRNPETLIALRQKLTDETLVAVYQLWWTRYSSEVQSAPSARSGEGISRRDARVAGDAADLAVVNYLRG